MDQTLSVREMEISDLHLLGDYWYNINATDLRKMGADPDKLPNRDDFLTSIATQIKLSTKEKNAYPLIWMSGSKEIGHCNVNQIIFGENAFMHLHLWHIENRIRGMGAKLVALSLPYFFNQLELQKLISEPFAMNPAPNKTLKKIGFSFIKEYVTTPGPINFEQKVKRWEMTKTKFVSL